MSQAAKAQEPSMEEILASIRRIIADDDGKAGANAAPAAEAPRPASPDPAPVFQPAPASEPEADILDLTDAMRAPASFRTIDAEPDVIFAEPASGVEPVEPEPVTEPLAQAPAARESLLSQTTAAAVDSAFNTLAQTVLVQNARTLEDLVKEMLRPMLKTWLDDNLPGLVERLVRAEIERVSRGRSS